MDLNRDLTDFEQAKEVLHKKIVLSFSRREREGCSLPGIRRVEVGVSGINPVDWLVQQPFEVKTFWSDRDGLFTMAGVGSALHLSGQNNRMDYYGIFSSLFKILASSDVGVRFYGGTRFTPSSNPEDLWKIFGTYSFSIPLFELVSFNRERSFLVCNFDPNIHKLSFIVELLQELSFQPPCLRKERFAFNDIRYVCRRDVPDLDRWKTNVKDILSRIEPRKLEKVVLARKTEIFLSGSPDPVLILEDLCNQGNSGYMFYFQPEHGTSFLGLTPERLYRRRFRYIETEALAGTRGRGKDVTEDSCLARDLKTNPKDIQEHRWVSVTVKERMKELCTAVEVLSCEQVFKLPNIQHLRTQFCGRLRCCITDGDIVTSLHPSPAVAGYPKEEALRQIRPMEDFDRGWYAGPVGWVSKDSAEFAVAIRSSLVHENRVFLYAGAGIVLGSEPLMEWNEVENKIANFTMLLGV